MPQWHGDLHKRKKTGGRTRPYRGKRAFEMGSDPSQTIVGEQRIVAKITRGGGIKRRALAVKFANVTDPSSTKSQRVEIKGVVKNPANVDYERRGVVTKGAIIQTELGEAKVTSRPGQTGAVNAILIAKTQQA